ncbi:spinster family MFS transporter [Hyphococcus luteus]|uniref:spinster family MFS transporter n=1 Tax=Hyphococcus luteus TaxID=2058213 RepID=UPI00105741A0|nr:MFS transporter [Marinicaulis flavus]
MKSDVESVHQTSRVSQEAWLVLALLTTAMAISFADRYVLAMLIEPIKKDLGFSDSKIGFITGFAFSAFYALFGLLIARISDSYGVRRVIIASLVFWSLMTALCGAAQNFIQMLLVRFGVGAGEAGVAPAAHATLARMFPRDRRSLPLAVFSAGGPAGIVFALLTSGYLENLIGWRWTFLIMSLPGLILAAVILRYIKLIPDRGLGAQPTESSGGNWAAIKSLFRTPSFISINLLLSALVFFAFGQAQWIPAYFERSFGATRADLGLTLALTQGIGMIIGVVAGGLFSDWLMIRNPKLRNYFIAATLVAAAPLAVSVFLVSTMKMASIFIALATLLTALPSGALWASIQDAAPDRFRATGSAFAMMVASMLGLGLGPLLIGVLSDLLAHEHGIHSLRFALLYSVTCTGILMLAPIASIIAAQRRA